MCTGLVAHGYLGLILMVVCDWPKYLDIIIPDSNQFFDVASQDRAGVACGASGCTTWFSLCGICLMLIFERRVQY